MTSRTVIAGPCPRCGTYAQRRPVRVSSVLIEPLPGFGEAGMTYRLNTFTVRCATCLHIWPAETSTERTATQEAGR